MPSKSTPDISSRWLHALVEFAIDGVITMDDTGRIIAFNPAAEKIFGYRSDQVVGQTVSDRLIPASMREAHEKGLAGFLATGGGKIINRRVEVNAMRADRSVFPAEMDVISVSQDSPQVFMAYIRDISEQKQAERERLRLSMNIKKMLLQTILVISRTVEIRDPYTAGHQRRVAHLAANIAKAIRLSEERMEGVVLGALIHDIGKIAVPSEILSRPGKLTDEDISYLQTHPRKGYNILKPVSFPWPIAEIAFQHHEHLDGSGYPQGLKDGEIIVEAEIVCVADVVESLTSHRPYRPARPVRSTLEHIISKAGTWYDPGIVNACCRLFDQGYRIEAIDMDELTRISSLSL